MARRLWLDAMKGKIMAQRVLIATCLVVMLACGASVGLAWNWMNQDRLLRSRESAAAIEANRRMAEALAQAQATNKDMLEQVERNVRGDPAPGFTRLEPGGFQTHRKRPPVVRLRWECR